LDTKTPVHLSDDQRLDWLRLIRSENVGPRGIMAQTPQDSTRRPGTQFLLRSEIPAADSGQCPNFIRFSGTRTASVA
jgi:hypothetical protein